MVAFLSFLFFPLSVCFFSFRPLAWSGHLNYHNWHFSTASATFPLHCINYRAGINLTARSSDRSTQVCSSLAIRWNRSFSFIFYTRHIVYVQTESRREYIPWSTQKYSSVAVFKTRNSSETKQPFETVLHGIVHDQREFATIYSILVKFIIPVRRDMSSSLKIPTLLRWINNYDLFLFYLDNNLKNDRKRRGEREKKYTRAIPSNMSFNDIGLKGALLEQKPLQEINCSML